MNNDLISREALKEEINKRRIVGRFNTIQIIDNAPTVKTYTEEDLKKKYDEGVNAGYAICYDRYIRKNSEPFS